MGRLAPTSLGSSYLLAHVLHSPPSNANCFMIGTAVTNNNPLNGENLQQAWVGPRKSGKPYRIASGSWGYTPDPHPLMLKLENRQVTVTNGFRIDSASLRSRLYSYAAATVPSGRHQDTRGLDAKAQHAPHSDPAAPCTARMSPSPPARTAAAAPALASWSSLYSRCSSRGKARHGGESYSKLF